MRYDLAVEKTLLEYVEANESELGVAFSDHEYIKKHNWPGDLKQAYMKNRNLDGVSFYHLKQMVERGFLDDRNSTLEEYNYRLTSFGHERLAELRENTIGKRVLRTFGRWADRAMTSIVLPIVVSILTVILMNMLGLTGGTANK